MAFMDQIRPQGGAPQSPQSPQQGQMGITQRPKTRFIDRVLMRQAASKQQDLASDPAQLMSLLSGAGK